MRFSVALLLATVAFATVGRAGTFGPCEGFGSPADGVECEALSALAFVHRNSRHNTGGLWAQRNAGNVEYVVELLHASENGAAFKPQLSCGSRSMAMKVLLEDLGIRARLVQFYSDRQDTVQGHRLVEVWNEDRDRWELYDPDFGVVYRDEGGEIVDSERLVFGALDGVRPVGPRGEGWDALGMSALPDYFGAVLYESHDRSVGMKNAVILYNAGRFEAHKRFAGEGGKTFYEWARKWYGAPRIIGVAAGSS